MAARIFVDSSVLVAALLSDRGASYFLLTNSQARKNNVFQINDYVLQEVLLVIDQKLLPEHKSKLFLLLGLANIEVLLMPLKSGLKTLQLNLESKDKPILFSALAYSDYLLTLDNDFFSEEVMNLAKKRHLVIMKPGDYVRNFDP